MSDNNSLLKFPCSFPIKIFGLTENNIETIAIPIINQHVNNLGEGATKSRLSRDGKYTALTITIQAQSQQQLDAIYQDLSKQESFIMVL